MRALVPRQRQILHESREASDHLKKKKKKKKKKKRRQKKRRQKQKQERRGRPLRFGFASKLAFALLVSTTPMQM